MEEHPEASLESFRKAVPKKLNGKENKDQGFQLNKKSHVKLQFELQFYNNYNKEAFLPIFCEDC